MDNHVSLRFVNFLFLFSLPYSVLSLSLPLPVFPFSFTSSSSSKNFGLSMPMTSKETKCLLLLSYPQVPNSQIQNKRENVFCIRTAAHNPRHNVTKTLSLSHFYVFFFFFAMIFLLVLWDWFDERCSKKTEGVFFEGRRGAEVLSYEGMSMFVLFFFLFCDSHNSQSIHLFIIFFIYELVYLVL